jgi:D-alanyl-D-alanine carboxypeptidase (penicillin-binding protein 5/6)
MEDLSSGAVLFAKDADRRMPPASMAKMMTVYVAFELIKSGQLKLDQEFEVRPETWKRWHGPQAGSTMFLATGERVSVANLLYGIVTLSGNDACVVLAEGISGTEQSFVQRMNEYAQKIGLTNSHFGTANGWPDEGVTYVTARDLGKLAAATIEDHPKLYKQFYSRRDFTWGKTMGGAEITQANRDPLLGRVAGADGLKTGHTEEAGYGFTGSAEQNGRRLVMVIAGLTSFNQRASESVRFMDWGFRAWQAKPVVKAGRTVGKANVQMGDASTVDLVAPRDVAVSLPSGTQPKLAGRIVYDGPVKAPIKKGAHVADLVVTTAGGRPQTTPLVAAADVGEAGFFRRAWNGLTGLFG